MAAEVATEPDLIRDNGGDLFARCLEAAAARTVDETSCVVPVPGVIDAAVATSYLDPKYGG